VPSIANSACNLKPQLKAGVVGKLEALDLEAGRL